MEGTLSTQRQLYQQMPSSDFRGEIGRRWDTAGKVVDLITEQVENDSIDPLVAAETIACTIATVFGYQELHTKQGERPN